MELPTPLDRAPDALAAYAGCDDLWLKREDVHELGMFKWRAALPVVRELAVQGQRTIVTSSTGNHGAAVAWACREHGSRAIVFVPPGATETKLALLTGLGADVRVAGDDLDSAKDTARAWALSNGLHFFEDGAEPLQYEAYRAIGDEILDQLGAPPAAVVTPIGNGALAGGVGAAVGARSPVTTRVGVVAKAMPVMAESFEAGRPVEVGPGYHDRGRARRSRRDPAGGGARSGRGRRDAARLRARDRGRARRLPRGRRRGRAVGSGRGCRGAC